MPLLILPVSFHGIHVFVDLFKYWKKWSFLILYTFLNNNKNQYFWGGWGAWLNLKEKCINAQRKIDEMLLPHYQQNFFLILSKLKHCASPSILCHKLIYTTCKETMCFLLYSLSAILIVVALSSNSMFTKNYNNTKLSKSVSNSLHLEINIIFSPLK